MSDEFGEFSEREPRKPQKTKSSSMTLEKAVEMGEYDPSFLATFPEWATFSNNIRFNYIMRAIKNRKRFLQLNYAETFNVIDFSLKPELKIVLQNIQNKLAEIQKDEEKLRLEYSTKL